MAGIAVGYMCDVSASHILYLFVISAAALLFALFRFAPKWLFGTAAMALMLTAGLFVEAKEHERKAPEWSGEKQRYSATLLEVPAMRGTNVKVLARVERQGGEDVGNLRDSGNVYLYFQPTVDTEQLKIGDRLSFEGVMLPPENSGNPAEFDVEKFYYIKDITGTCFVAADKWTFLPAERKTLQMHALALRSRAVGLYERLGFEDEELALLSALTLGEKRDFPQELKESYSAAGASHVLALSGLHLGILYMLLAFVLPTLNGRFIYRLLRETLIVALLWAFAFVAGLSPSVVRSATLFTLMSAGRLLARDVSPVSSLSFAAIAMLLFSPHLLFDVSFQLSFAAVFSILLLAPALQELLKVYEHGILYEYIMNMLILSFAAQAGTLPFIWYYFGAFPLYFLLTNIVVVPLAFVVMAIAVLLWAMSPLPFLQQPVAYILKWAVAGMNGAVELVASMPGASYALPSLDLFGAVLAAMLLLLLSFSFIERKWRVAVLASLISLTSLATAVVLQGKPSNENYLLIYNNRKNPLLHAVCGSGENYLLSTVPQADAQYEYVSQPYAKREKLCPPLWAGYDYNDENVSCIDGTVMFDGLKVKLLDNAYWNENEYAEPVDILVLCRGFLGKIKDAVEVYPPSCLVVDASLYKRSRERIIRECSQLGIDAVDISSLGAVKVVSSADSFDLIPMRGK